MLIKNTEDILLRNIGILARTTEEEMRMVPDGDGPFPSIEGLKEIMRLVRAIVFPDFFDSRRNDSQVRLFSLGVNVERLYKALVKEITSALHFHSCKGELNVEAVASNRAADFINMLPEVKRLLYTDVEAIFNNDPAVDNYGEIILSYPVVNAMTHYRAAHALLELGVPAIPRILTEMAHSITGIDINPGATIGEYFAIDHGTGVVIGQTCVIGNHVTIYQGVTLGARNFTLDDKGHPVNVPRHPILEDNVTVYSNASVLGRITVGHDSIIGGNVWLTESVPPGSRILQSKAIQTQR